MKFKTVREGQQAVVFNYLGEGRLIIGPERVFLYRERLQYLKSYTANQYQFLVLKDKDGVVTHKRGPCEVFHNTMMYDSIEIKDATKIDANHLIVVYKRLKDNDVQRRIIQGPTVFVPEAEEWLHQFTWHGCDATDKTRMIPGHNKFTQLAIIPDQFYYNVRDVRTVDDTMITVKLMIFYNLNEILKMLDTTHDPVADMINAVCADIITFAGKNTFEDFLRNTHKLSELSSFPELTHRAERIGYQIQKVVFRGYHANDRLQLMQSSAIETRTQLRLNAEIEEMKQHLQNFKLSKEEARTKLKQEMEKAEQDHKQMIDNMKQVHELEIKQLQHEQSLKVAAMTTSSKLDDQKAKNSKEIEHLSKLSDLGVDVTLYLTLQHKPPTDQEIRVSTPVFTHTDL
ncbi:uncharacterized protein LOC132562749 [Ylistrum balloti]|uniref:uncharacterized protein LOC132562749 n=1 Tax=Ylistrum balloti TaxID=509963 RepID=UPI002905DDF7|nr:uncharacterized protein LOC132562749 [Ylistrum balloti]